MTTRRATALTTGLVLLSFVSASCSSSSADSRGTGTGDSTSTDVTSTTSADSTSTSSTSATTSSSATVAGTSTTLASTVPTTVPVGASIALREDGLGDALFGAEPEGVISYLRGLLGPPTSDSGWVSAPERTCPGTEVRNVLWGDLSLMFGDQSLVRSDARHFFEWSYGQAAGEVISPFGMTTPFPQRIGVGSTVTQLRTAYPTATIFAGDELVGPSASITVDLSAFISNTGPTGEVTSLEGGHGCGE